MEAKAAELLAAFRNPNVSIDSKVTHLTSIKSDIKQKNVPEAAIPTIFETLKLALSSQHYNVSAAGFSTLGHFIKRLSIQDQQHWIVSQTKSFYPLLLERLGDHKEAVRTKAAQVFTDLWPIAHNEVEYFVLECALVGKNPRAKEMSLLWLAKMTRNHDILFRKHVPALVACLEDADSAVRDSARGVVVELFRNAPARAKSDLQRQLVTHSVRKSIANAILSGIGLGSVEPEGSNRSLSRAERPISRAERPKSRAERPISVISSRPQALDGPEDDVEFAGSRPGSSRSHYDRPTASSSETSARPKTPAEVSVTQSSPDQDAGVEPFLVSSAKDLDEIVRDMVPWFDGKESEDNWMKREKNVILFRKITRGNAPSEFTQSYLHATKTLLDGFFKVVNSLRTTLCTNGCLLIQDIARTCGPKIDSMVEIIMQNLIKLCGALKKIAAQNGNTTVDVVIGNVTYNIRILQHIHWASQDKNVQLRLFAPGWLRTLISRQAHHKSTVEHGGGLELIEKSLKKGLADPNPGVREAVRSTFWTFYGVWPDRANGILSNLDAKSRALLEKDPSNPNAAQNSSGSSVKGSNMPGRSALKEAIAARRKAQTPSRPDSAQSALTGMDPLDVAPKPPTRTVPTGAPLSSLSSAPMRPAMKPRRPELSRPATADPYARRPDSRTQTSSKPVSSPRSVRSKAATPSSKPINAPRLRPHEPCPVGTTRDKPKKLDLSKSKSHGDLIAASRARSDSNESVSNRSLRAHPVVHPPSASEELNSPVPVVLESPSLSATQPLSHPREQIQPEQAVASEPVGGTQPLSLEESFGPPASPLSHVKDMSISLRHSQLISNPESTAKAQSDDMVIYEDPATPIAGGSDTPNGNPVGYSTPTRSSRRADGSPVGENSVRRTPVASYTPLGSSPDLLPQQEFVTDRANEPQFPSPVRRTPLRRSPSPSRNGPLATPSEPHDGLDTILQQQAVGRTPQRANNENATANIAKITEYAATPRSAAKSGALEEVSLNESIARTADTRHRSHESPAPSVEEEPFRRSRKWAERHRSPSPRSKDPANAREMLHKGLTRIASKTMDISGYRKLQGLFQYHGEGIVSREQDYYAMLEALLIELESAPNNRKDHDVKIQILATIRSMLLRTGKLFHRYDVPAMAAIIRARRHYESNSHFVTCLEEMVEQLVSLIPMQTVINGVLQGLDFGEDSKNDDSYRSIIMGLSAIHQALLQGPIEISDEILASVGTVASQQLSHPRPGVRKQATELCTLLNLRFGLDRVQKVALPAGEGSLNLLTYFMARRSQ